MFGVVLLGVGGSKEKIKTKISYYVNQQVLQSSMACGRISILKPLFIRYWHQKEVERKISRSEKDCGL